MTEAEKQILEHLKVIRGILEQNGAFYGCGVTRPPQSWCYVEEIEE